MSAFIHTQQMADCGPSNSKGLGGGCRRSVRWGAKYELLHTVRTHMGASDANFGCVVQREDEAGKVRPNYWKQV